jgi:hypothetical protein
MNRWGIYLVGPCGQLDRMYVVRAESYDKARNLIQQKMGTFENYPVEVIGDAIVDAFPRIICVGDMMV